MLNSASLVAEHDFPLVIYYISNKCFGSAKGQGIILSDGVLNPLFEILRI